MFSERMGYGALRRLAALVLLLTAAGLFLATRQVRKLEINYGAE